jgi:sigma-B regulation protein RsbU (phosphoserine phosphatase)
MINFLKIIDRLRHGLSIKWKISLALICTGLILIGTYVVLAKRLFESDKISYVFETQNSRLMAQRREIEQRFERVAMVSNTLVGTFDPLQGIVTSAGEKIFKEQGSLLFIELLSDQTRRPLFQLTKGPGNVLPADDFAPLDPNTLKISAQSAERFVIEQSYGQDEKLGRMRIRAIFELSGLLPQGETQQELLLLQNGHLLNRQDSASEGHDGQNLHFKMLERLSAEVTTTSGNLKDRTMIWMNQGSRYLVSTATVGIGNFTIISVTPEMAALGALSTLFNRSMIFLLLSAFGLVAVSLTLARGITSNLKLLTEAVQNVGRGNFGDVNVPSIDSGDEINVLSGAMKKMSHEIQHLLIETKDKGRMEAELKTARIVQERLLPSKAVYTFNEIEISGVSITSTECGGDWWHYFSKGNDLYIAIADATGHGTPAALITASARSIFSRLETENLSLPQMMKSWDVAVRSCSHGQVCMTGILLKIDSITGRGTLVAAGHEFPYICKPQAEGEPHDVDVLPLNLGEALGEGISDALEEQEFSLEPGGSLILYTDGLFSVEGDDGKQMSERRFAKAIATDFMTTRSAEEMTKSVVDIFEGHRAGKAIPDDVTVVSVRRTGVLSRAAVHALARELLK